MAHCSASDKRCTWLHGGVLLGGLPPVSHSNTAERLASDQIQELRDLTLILDWDALLLGEI